MNLGKADVARLGRRDERPKRAPGELLAILVHGPKLRNPLNPLMHPLAYHRYRDGWHDAVWQVLLEAGCRTVYRWDCPYGFLPNMGSQRLVDAVTRKRIVLTAYSAQKFDGTEGLRAALKPIPDVLARAGVVDDDGPDSGHCWEYHNVVDPKRNGKRGVEIRVSLLAGRDGE